MTKPSGHLFSLSKGNHIHYLFGTIHLSIDAIQWPRNKVVALLNKSEGYYAEMDLSKSETLLPQQFKIPQQQTYLSFLPEKKLQKMAAILDKSFGVDLNDYVSIHPIFLQFAIDQSIVGGNEIVLDQYLWEVASHSGLEMGGLESRLDQLNILHRLDLEFQIGIIRKIARNVSAYRKSVKSMVGTYNQGDYQKLYKRAARSLGSFRSLMLFERNLKMANKINGLEKKSMITVGAGHLGGNKGILALLKRAGWQISALSI